MKKIIEKILLQKTLVAAFVIAFAVAVIALTYILYGVSENVQKMASEQEDVTYFPTYPTVDTTGKNEALIKRGEYLAKAGDCAACHTNTYEEGKIFAGGLPMRTPFGTIYTPNITSDKETGIGHWTNEQFIKAMREGISPQGHYYFPAFPYYYFNKVTDEDLIAIKAYLDALPPIKQVNKEPDMVWPFNYRFLQLGWRILFFHPTRPYENDPRQTDQWNRGAYLTEGLGHCAMCHSPSYHLISQEIPLGAPILTYNLTGSKIQGYLAPNISKSNLDKASEEEIVDVFTKDALIGGGKVAGPMLEVNKDSLSYLSHEDLTAIAHYLKSVVSKTPPKPKFHGGPGKGIYEMYCSGCHLSGAGGAPRFGDVSAWTPVLAGGMTKVYNNAIQGYGGMPAKGTCISCDDDEIKLAVDYMAAAVSGKKGEVVTAQKKLTLADGKRLYDDNCAVCHKVGYKNAPKLGDKDAFAPIIKQGFIEIYGNLLLGRNHPPQGGCSECSDEEIKAALKYLLQESSDQDFRLW